MQYSLPTLVAPPMALILVSKQPKQFVPVNTTHVANCLYASLPAGPAIVHANHFVSINPTPVTKICLRQTILTTIGLFMSEPLYWSCATSIRMVCFIEASGRLETALSNWHVTFYGKKPFCSMPVALESHLHHVFIGQGSIRRVCNAHFRPKQCQQQYN